MSFSITPTTELEAVNECLENIGQAPVATISGSLGVDTQIALNFVRKVNRELQSQGWNWNTEYDYTLTPTIDGDILLPSGTLAVRSDGADADMDVVIRGSRLWDRVNKTYTFTRSIKVRITIARTFEELPEAPRRYIAMRAARLFQNRIESREDQGDLFDEQRTYAIMQADELANARHNVLTGSYGMFRTLERTRS